VEILVLVLLVNFALGRLLRPPKTGPPSLGVMFVEETASFLVVFLPALGMSRLESRRLGAYGLPLAGAFRGRFWHGCLLGLAEISLLMASIAAAGGYRFGSLELQGAAILRWALAWALFFVLVGLFEEFAFRGYLQFTLADGIGFWPAAWILSL